MIASEPRDCTALLQSLTDLVKDGSHLLITRHIIPQGLIRILKLHSTLLPESNLLAEDHAILTQVFLAVDDLWGLLQVNYYLLPIHSLSVANQCLLFIFI